jgi:hypothetical protein
VADRWDRLFAELAAKGIQATLDRKLYQEFVYGRPVRGISSSIFIRHPDGGSVEVDDKYGRGGKWYGWTVTRVGHDSIIIGRPTWGTTKRSEVVNAVSSMLDAAAEVAGRG